MFPTTREIAYNKLYLRTTKRLKKTAFPFSIVVGRERGKYWYDMIWNDMLWYGMVRYGKVAYVYLSCLARLVCLSNHFTVSMKDCHSFCVNFSQKLFPKRALAREVGYNSEAR